MRVTLAGFAFAAAVRMVHRVHHDTADGGAHAEPANRPGFAEHPQIVLVVSDLADGGAAIDVDLAHFAGFQSHAGVHALARRELRGAAGTTRQLAALADFEFDVVYGAADRDVPEGKRVARLDRRIGARTDFIAGLDALRRQDVAALAVLVQHQREVRRAVRIVFQAFDDTGNPVLVTLEIHQPVALLVTAADVPRRLPAGVVAGAGAILLRGQG